MKAKNVNDKIYVSPKAYLGRSETFCRGFCRDHQIAIYLNQELELLTQSHQIGKATNP